MENTATFEEIVLAAKQLSHDEKEALSHILLEELGSGQFASKDIEAAWIEEAERRWDAYKRGELKAIDGDEAMAHLRSLVR